MASPAALRSRLLRLVVAQGSDEVGNVNMLLATGVTRVPCASSSTMLACGVSLLATRATKSVAAIQPVFRILLCITDLLRIPLSGSGTRPQDAAHTQLTP